MSDTNTERMELMVKYGLTSCEWDDNGRIRSASREPMKNVSQVAQPRAARDLAASIRARRLHQHETMFAHTSVRPKALETEENPVPRAVRAKQESRGRTEVG